MSERRRSLERLKALLVALSFAITMPALTACSRDEEKSANEEEKSGYLIVQPYPYYVDGKTYSGNVEYAFVEDESLGDVVKVTREYYNNNIKYKNK